MTALNLGILAHVDAGKTSLTERLLHHAGVIAEPGSVDEGSTQTDTLALERQRGITIRSAVVAFELDGVPVNLIDTPGHPDFIAEVERVLSVLDGAVLVVSAVEGVQAQTRVLMRVLRRLRIPTLIFANKIDRAGARVDGLLADIAGRLTPDLVPMGGADRLGTRAARAVPAAGVPLEPLAEHDERLLAAYVADHRVPDGTLRRALRAQTRAALVHPVFFGSAATGAGVPELATGIARLLPTASGDPTATAAGTVFKIERGPAGEKIAYVRMFAGTLAVRDRTPAGRVTSIAVFEGGAAPTRPEVRAGHIARVWGLAGARVGDPLGTPVTARQHHFAPPSLETVVSPCRAADRTALYAALAQLAEQDPLIALRLDERRQEIAVSLYGEVQKEVIAATLADEYGIPVTCRETSVICVERVLGTGEAYEIIDTPTNPFLATVGLRVAPGPPDSGVGFELGVELGSMPYAFFTAVEETVYETLREGPFGWQVTDCVVTMTHSGYWPRQSHMHGTFDASMSSTAGDFRHLTPLVLMSALRRAGTGVHEPVHAFHLELPADLYGATLPALTRLRAVPRTATPRGPAYHIDGDIPAAHLHELELRLPPLTRGEGILETAFSHYQPVRGEPPTRPRTDQNPLDREEYLLHVQRRV